MKDGSDAIADWPILNAMINAINGRLGECTTVVVLVLAASIHAGMVAVDGSDIEVD